MKHERRSRSPRLRPEEPPAPLFGTRRTVPLLCLFLSGAAGLIAEVCWIRSASLVFGSTIHATSVVVAVFFLGLALGGWLFGRVSLRVARPLRMYAFLEIGLAVLVLASPFAFDAAESLYGAIYRASSGVGPSTSLLRGLLVSLVVLPPAFLMGGTLPLFSREFVRRPARIAGPVGLVYAVNTLGAAAGCAAAGFLLLPSIGMRHSIQIGALLSLTAGAVALLLSRAGAALTASPREIPAVEAGPVSIRRTRAAVGALFLAAGFVALGHEVLWTRFLGLVVRATVHTYTLSLTVVLLGIVLGSWLASTFADRIERRARLFGALQVSGALVVLATILLPPAAWRALGSETWTCLVLMLLPAVLSGATFPLAVRMVAEDPAAAGRDTGTLLALNTLGGILGSLAAGFFALPHLGLARSVALLTGIGLATGFAAWWMLDRSDRAIARSSGPGSLPTRALVTAACLGAWLLIPRLLTTRLPADFLAERSALVDFREGLESNLAVVRVPRALQLEADRWWQGQDTKTHQIMAAHVPMLLHPHPRRALVVGVGAGQTPERILLYDVERLDCVDIEPAVFDLVARHFSGAWMRDPRVRLLREDGRNFIVHTGERYDVISLEVGQLFRPGAAAFYTADFYRRARARLEPGGILSQFVPLTFLTPEMFRSVVASFLDAFPRSILWYNTSELLLLGWNAEGVGIDPARLTLLASNAAVSADLRWSHWDGPSFWLNHPHVFLGGYLSGPDELEALTSGARLLRDDRPVLAYATRNAGGMEANELPILDLLRPRLGSLAGILTAALPDSTLRAAAAVRERNLGDMVASAYLRRVEPLRTAGRHDELEAVLLDALRGNPENVLANRLLGDLEALRGRAEEAKRLYAFALALAPDDVPSHLGLARLLQMDRRFAEAVEHYRVGLERTPGDPEIHNNLGAALAEQGDFEGARRHFEEALRLRPGYADAGQNLAILEQHLARSGRTAP